MKAGRQNLAIYCYGYNSIPESQVSSILKSGARDRDLILSYAYCHRQNFNQHQVILDITGYQNQSYTSTSDHFQLYPNILMDMMYVYERFLKNSNHNCAEIMDLSMVHLYNVSF